MHPVFSVTLFTGQQLVLEAIQRWLQRPCADAEAQRQRRLGLKGLISLLLRTAATGVLATVLDAAIEFRRRQLLAAAARQPGEDDDAAGAAGASRFPGLGMLSRAGIAAWKSRLLLAVDELERRAEAYGIESRYRFSEGKLDAAVEEAAAGSGSKAAAGSPLLAHPMGSSASLAGDSEERSQRLGRTVEQLRELVQQGDPEADRRLDDEVGSLVDLLLGTLPPPPSPTAAAAAAATQLRSVAAPAGRSVSVPASLDRLAASGAAEPRASGGLRLCRSRAMLATAAAEPAAPCAAEPTSPSGSSGSSVEVCHICMDRPVRVQVAGCCHELCFACARRLCASQDHQVPQCPFCRQPIDGFAAIAGEATSADVSPVATTAAAVAAAVHA